MPPPGVVAVRNQPIGGYGQPGGAVGTVGEQVELGRRADSSRQR